mmetsp:Transcript_5946/g.8779  ORF Transcript_5946/g.8779 Transcript_5946/m.8779 type:complete len:190 (-) Transcript_5946:177-746(-)
MACSSPYLVAALTVSKASSGSGSGLGESVIESAGSATLRVAQRLTSQSWLQEVGSGRATLHSSASEPLILIGILCFVAFALVGVLALFGHHWSQSSGPEQGNKPLYMNDQGFGGADPMMSQGMLASQGQLGTAQSLGPPGYAPYSTSVAGAGAGAFSQPGSTASATAASNPFSTNPTKSQKARRAAPCC